jgi:hypothetical protein
MLDRLKEDTNEFREVAPGVHLRRKDSQKFLEDLINAGNPVWIWIERISLIVTPVLVLFVLMNGGM